MSDARREEKKASDDAKLEWKTLPYIPPQVKLEDLTPELCLMTQAKINKFKGITTPKSPDDKAPSTKYKIPKAKPHLYSILLSQNEEKKTSEYFAIYTGKLAGGGFGKIRLAQNLETKEWVAIKLQKRTLEAENEYSLHRTLGTAKSVAIIREKKPKSTTGMDQKPEAFKQHIMAMTLVPGVELTDYVSPSQENISADMLNLVAKAITAVVEFNQKDLIHRDIKSRNLMYDYTTGKVVLVDIGLAITKEKSKNTDIVGTPGYMSPELQTEWLKKPKETDKKEENALFNEATEVFALGVTIAETLRVGKWDKYEKSELDKLRENEENNKERIDILETFGQFRLHKKEDLAKNPRLSGLTEEKREAVLSFIERMTANTPKERPTLKEAQEFFSTLQLEQEKVSTRTFGVIDYKEFQSLDALEKSLFFQSMAKNRFEEIFISAAPGVSDYDLIKFKRDITTQMTPCRISDNVIINPEGMSLSNILSELNKGAKEKNSTYIDLLNLESQIQEQKKEASAPAVIDKEYYQRLDLYYQHLDECKERLTLLKKIGSKDIGDLSEQLLKCEDEYDPKSSQVLESSIARLTEETLSEQRTKIALQELKSENADLIKLINEQKALLDKAKLSKDGSSIVEALSNVSKKQDQIFAKEDEILAKEREFVKSQNKNSSYALLLQKLPKKETHENKDNKEQTADMKSTSSNNPEAAAPTAPASSPPKATENEASQPARRFSK